MNTYCFTLKNGADLEEAWDELETLTIQLHYSAEEPEQGVREIYGDIPHAFNQELLTRLKNFVSMKKVSSEIDWNQQWETYSQFYKDGFVHVDLTTLCPAATLAPQWSTIRLEPGPGFGDLSHSTTLLVLNLMQKKMRDQLVLDIGCGSGILSFAAIAMGAQEVCGIDIDYPAVEHARKNGVLNQMVKGISFIHPAEITGVQGIDGKRYTVLMNMIQSEQLVAWESMSPFHAHVSDCLISGILAEGRDIYLAQAKNWGWTLREEIQENGWLAFHFTANR